MVQALKAPRIKRSFVAATVHLKLFPMPRTFSERREVLRVIERFGEVVMFKSLKYQYDRTVPNAFLSMFATDSAAQDLINASPIRYRLIAKTPSADPSDPLFPSPADADNEEPVHKEETLFELTASPSTFNTALDVQDPYSNPLYGPYVPVATSASYISASLSNNVPKSLWAAGLRDWETVKMRTVNGDLSMENMWEGRKEVNATGNFTKSQREREKVERATPKVMRGLRALVEAREARAQKEQAEMGLVGEATEIKSNAAVLKVGETASQDTEESPAQDSKTQLAPVM